MFMRQYLAKTLAALVVGSAASLPLAHADDSPLWSLAIGVPGLVANIGNAYPVAPPVYVAPPVQYVAPPVYYAAPPVYVPGPPYREDRRRWRHGDRHHGDDDE